MEDNAQATPSPEEPQPPQGKFKRFLNQHVKPFVFVVLILCMVRSSIADWNDVPTGSMNPSILEGDRIFVNKLAYDLKVPFTTWHLAEWSEPQRGDVVVFYAPGGVRMVKRIIGVPGDAVTLSDNRLYVNGQAAQYGPADPSFTAAMQGRPLTGPISSETLGGKSHPVMELPQVNNPNSTFGPSVVPQGKYFMMGDNRDNSQDSRYWGVIERSQIVGRASAVAISLDPEKSYWPRWQRFFMSLP